MKKVISFIIIALSLVAIVIVEQIYLNSSFDTLIQKIDTLNEQIVATENINTQQIQNTTYDLQEYWKNIENILCMTINYNDLHRIGEQIQRVKAYVEQDQKDDCVAEIEVLKFYAENYQMIFQINFSNIF